MAVVLSLPGSVWAVKAKNARRMPGGFIELAGVQGFEPRSYGPEPHVLPLDDTPEGPQKGT